MSRRIALLIGNVEYEDSFYQNLQSPGHNVTDLEQVLKDSDRCGFEVIKLVNTSRADAEKQIFNLFRNKTKDDFLVFYFAGHGVKADDGTLHFAMKDTARDAIEVTAVSATFLRTHMKKSFAEHIVVILDCCYSGAFGDTMSVQGEMLDLKHEFDGSGSGRVVLTASNAIQYAWDRNTDALIGNPTDHSVFTRHLIEGIASGNADMNADGEITIDELYTYVYERTVGEQPNQTPKIIIDDMRGNLVFAKNPSPKKLSKDLLSALTDPRQSVRLGAVIQLDDLIYIYQDQNPDLLEEIKIALTRLSSDRSDSVANQAKAVLEKLVIVADADVIPDAENTFNLFISSPGDVEEERDIVRRVIDRLNADPDLRKRVHINAVAWDDPTNYIPLFAHETPQLTINDTILRPSACDIVVVIFWSRIGTPLPADILKPDGSRYESGTEWEYEDAAQKAKLNDGYPLVMVYRSQRPLPWASAEKFREKLAQMDKVDQFFAKFSDEDKSLKGGYNTFVTTEEFEVMVEQHLRIAIKRLLNRGVKPVDDATTQARPESQVNVDEYLPAYLKWVIEQHSQLELRGLGGDARLPTIPLEKVFVALKGQRASTYEREQSHELLISEMSEIVMTDIELMIDDQQFLVSEGISPKHLKALMNEAKLQAIITNPLMPSLVERDRPTDAPTADTSILTTLGDAFQKERWMVILGDPGSGKTTLARWIALKLATAMLNNEPSVIVPSYQIDPNIDKNNTQMVNIGPARLPILLRISEFSEAYQKARDDLQSLSIADFLGSHSWLGQFPNIPPEILNLLIKKYIRQGRAVIILDGMDEITAASQRDDVVRSIESFINDWVNAKGASLSGYEKSLLWNPLLNGEPASVGGNQIIITSRIVGYHAKPVTGRVTHVTIQPMQQRAVEHFCDSWTRAIHQLLNPNDDPETLEKEASIEARGLKNAIFDPKRPRVRELATNPLLITILALVYRKNEGRLPEQRAELYQTAMEILIEEWRATGIKTHEIVYVLSPLAAHMHEQSSQGAIKEREMIEIIRDELATYREEDISRLPPAFDVAVEDFIKRVKQQVGLISERSEEVFGFLHLTFQEYLAGLFLVRNKSQAPQAIIKKLDDPRWREPILMALGHISVNKYWGPKEQKQLLTALLNADDPLGNLIPRSALLIVSAIPEMSSVSEDVVKEIIRRLLTMYADRDGIGQFSSLQERLVNNFKNLYDGAHRPLLEEYLEKVLLDIEDGNRQLALAAASLIAENEWQTNPLTSALITAYPYDDADWDYPIMRALNAAVKLSPEALTAPTPPAPSTEKRSEYEKLQAQLDMLTTGEAQQALLSQIEALKADYDAQWSKFVAEITTAYITPREERLRFITSGEAMKVVMSHWEKETGMTDMITDPLDKFVDTTIKNFDRAVALQRDFFALRDGDMVNKLESELAYYRDMITDSE